MPGVCIAPHYPKSSAFASYLIAVSLVTPMASGQVSPLSAAPVAIDIQQGRGFADALTRIQELFGVPITYEEIPYENDTEKRSTTVIRNGLPVVRVVNPPTNVRMVLGAGDSTPYLATQSVLSAYKNSGAPGNYTVIPRDSRIDVMPAQVRGIDGSMRSITPAMSQPVTFPIATRSIAETLQLIVNNISSESGFKILLLDSPGSPLNTVELGATGLPARDVIANMGIALNRQLTFQCLYDVGDKMYYLNVRAVRH